MKPDFECAMRTGNGRSIPFMLAQNLPFGMHHLKITLQKASGMSHQYAFTFFGTSAMAHIDTEKGDLLGVEVDGTRFIPRPVINVIADKLYRVIRTLLDEHQPRIPYIMG